MAVNGDGEILAEARGASLHFLNLGLPAVHSHLQALIQSLLKQVPGTVRHMALGLAALDGPGDSGLNQALALPEVPAERISTDTDVWMTLIGASFGEPGLAVICGTGSMMLGLDARGRRHARGGFGHALGDAGSSFQLASLGLQAAIADMEGWGPGTELTGQALEAFAASDLREVIPKIYPHPFDPACLAGFARQVLALGQTDPTAREIVRSQMRMLAAQAAPLLQTHPEMRTVCLYGGVFEHNGYVRDLFREALAEQVPGLKVGLPELPPVCGSVLQALKRDGLLTDERRESLCESWKAWEKNGSFT